ncbi:MAG: DUF4194 domain-containing protein [Gammaproteobacteria bacterium]|nr:DUF4194 domain-containing protein [Gammaproteobacteria bacterium]
MNTQDGFPGEISPVLIHLLKGVLYGEQQPQLWQALLTFQVAVKSYFRLVGLEVLIDESEGYAFLRQAPAETESDREPVPRLIQRRPLSYPVSLLCVLLRKKLAEQDAAGGDTRVVLTRGQLTDMLRIFLPSAENEAKVTEQIGRHINRVIEYGFLRRLRGDEEVYEVRRIIKALVDADWVGDLDEKLKAYHDYAESKP